MPPDFSELDCQSVEFVEGLLDAYTRDPQAVPVAWQRYFAASGIGGNGQPSRKSPPFSGFSLFNPPQAGLSPPARATMPAELQARVDQLVHAYRVRGHLAAQLDPLQLHEESPTELSLETHQIDEAALDAVCSTAALGGPDAQTLRKVIKRLQSTYCRFIGAQFMHIDDPQVRNWLSERMEACQNRLELSREAQLDVLTRLTDAAVFEEFVRKKYIGAKTFSLAGAETLIPLLHIAIEKAGRQGTRGVVLGMAHRGRLNVLANIIGKSPHEIFWEFEDPNPDLHWGRGDVKYHLGDSGDWTTAEGATVHLSLCFNPSHLEFVNPVALGRTRAKQDRVGDADRRRWMTVLIHGDAAFAGEGIVQETLNLSQLPGFHTGGTLHVIVNNQLGFTTSPPEGRSTKYASDVAKMLQIPIFHVNGEHPEAVAQVVELAMDFRAKYQRDVVIDMYCYRRWGHNEADEPTFTQPRMYHAIDDREPIRDSYLQHLLTLEGITREEADEIAEEREETLREAFEAVKEGAEVPRDQPLHGDWQGYLGGPEPDNDDPDTGVSTGQLAELIYKLTQVPEDFQRHAKLQRSVEARLQMAAGDRPLDWSAAEALALASLAEEGHPVRLSGQDSARGTFSQRHAVVYDSRDGTPHCPLEHLSADQANVDIINSPLSEVGVLGFEYGYSMDFPEALVAWEAQFGDFWNTAQVIVDQFIASAEDKWQRQSGIILLLPHGFEGQGPEHSSARLERFLSLAAEDNLQVVCPTTPAQYFHCLRRQVKRRWRKPLVVLTPKSLLRHRQVVSSLDELAKGSFQRLLPDEDASRRVKHVLLCSGKVYYDLTEARQERQRHEVAILRVEQFYPLAEQELERALRPYAAETPVTWVQEEPVNMGAAPYWRLRFCNRLLDQFPFRVVARDESASPATGSKAAHAKEQAQLIDRAFDGN